MKLVAPLSIVFLLLTAPVFGSNITTSAVAPSGNIEISQLLDDGSLEQTPHRTISTTNWREVGQTFTVTTPFTLDKISVLFNQPSGYGYLTSGLQLHLALESVANTSTFVGGTSVAGFPDAGVTGSFSADTKLWMTFDVTNTALSAGVYAFRVGFSSDAAFNAANSIGDRGDGTGGFYFYDTEDNYADGQSFRAFPSAGTAQARYEDLAFIIQSGQAAAHPGDFNGDGNVDGLDFVAWQNGFPMSSGADLADGDGDGDGDVDGADFVIWQTNFPFTGSPGASPVPEPAGLLLASAGLAAFGLMRRLTANSARR